MQSRYYDPQVGRFINADALVSTGQGILGNNMFAYCQNNPCLYIDPTGHEWIVGYGFQFDVSTDHGTYGFEIVIYFDEKVVSETTGDDTDKIAIAIYTYSGISLSLSELLLVPEAYTIATSLNFEVLSEMAYDEAILTLIAILTDFELSGSVFAIYGKDSFQSAADYSGPFDTYSASASPLGSLINVGGFVSTSPTCVTVGFRVGGLTTPSKGLFPVSLQYSRTYYSDPYILQ